MSPRPYHVVLTSPCPSGMRARFLWLPVGLEPARGRALSGRAASVASRRERRQATEAGADLRSKYADVPPPRATSKQLIWDGAKKTASIPSEVAVE